MHEGAQGSLASSLGKPNVANSVEEVMLRALTQLQCHS